MNIEYLFEYRKSIGKNILNIIKDKGYTKSSFSRLVNISRPTLDKLIRGEVDNLTTFTTHIQKILESQNMNEEQLMGYIYKHNTTSEYDLALSDNSPQNYLRDSKTQKMFGILEDIVHLHGLYSK
ncbi:MAG: helix-turn-helix transcriptional regulator [Clostridiales bacterium]|nr:helix-turn-helix transcriptional regulator [Clostridiales bacterium]